MAKPNNLQLFKTNLTELMNISINELKDAKSLKFNEYDKQINQIKERILENKKEKLRIIEKDVQSILDELDTFKSHLYEEINETIDQCEALKLKSVALINLADTSKKALEKSEIVTEKKEEALIYINGKKILCEFSSNDSFKENLIGRLTLSITQVFKRI